MDALVIDQFLSDFVRVKSNDSPRPSTFTYPRELFDRTTSKQWAGSLPSRTGSLIDSPVLLISVILCKFLLIYRFDYLL